MCGIFGFIVHPDSPVRYPEVKTAYSHLFRLSESRGKEASGVAIASGNTLFAHRAAIPGTSLVKTAEYESLLKQALQQIEAGAGSASVAMVGHSRLVTNGLQGIGANNQPVVKGSIAVVHNGIVVNHEAIWDRHSELERESEVDTEAAAALVDHFLQGGSSTHQAIASTFAEIEGETSLGILIPDREELVLATNTGSLYYLHSKRLKVSAFVSELEIARNFIRKAFGAYDSEEWKITRIPPGEMIRLSFSGHVCEQVPYRNADSSARYSLMNSGQVDLHDTTRISENRRLNLLRCTRCVLPSTMPFITFDGQGVCNYCHNHEPISYLGREKLEQILETIRRSDGEPDCILAFSGGRDSCYALHLMVKELGLNPIAFTYDWGMVTDLGRRNQARMCSSLGVEHIWVSADIGKKRDNIRRNLNAWIKSPNLGLIPLMIAGDKQFFKHANRLQRELDLPTLVLAENRLERTDFKTGFCGVKPKFQRGSGSYQLNLARLFQLSNFYARSFLRNPRYLNRSLIDTASATFSYYGISHDYLWLFHYLDWDEATIDHVLRSEYDWELAGDTPRTWRIGDGTAAFYNHAFYTIAGFTEFDSFRSNQIREGVLSREEALDALKIDNRPRFDSIFEYCTTVGVNFDQLMRAIDQAEKLY